MEDELKKLKLIIMPCSDPVPEACREQYRQVYNLWHRVWSETLYQQSGLQCLHSDEFTRHHFCSAIFKDSEAISLFCYSTINLSLEVRKNDSWFSSWPRSVLDRLGVVCYHGLMPAWFCVADGHRRHQGNNPLNIAKLSVEVYAKILLHWNFSMGFGTAKNDRKVNKLLHEVGGTTCSKGVAYNSEVDHVVMYPEKVRKYEGHFSQALQSIWERRSDFWSENDEYPLSKPA